MAFSTEFQPEDSPIVMISFESNPKGSFAEISVCDIEGVSKVRGALKESKIKFVESSLDEVAKLNGISVSQVIEEKRPTFFTLENPDLSAVARALRNNDLITTSEMHKIQREFIWYKTGTNKSNIKL